MTFSKKVAKFNYSELEKLFNSNFIKVENKINSSKYITELRLKIDLRFEMNITFKTNMYLIKKGNITNVIFIIDEKKILFISSLMLIFMTIITFLIYPSNYSLLFGIITGTIVYYILKIQIEKEVDKYLRNLLYLPSSHPTSSQNK